VEDRLEPAGSISCSLISIMRSCASRFCSITNTVSCSAMKRSTAALNGNARTRSVSSCTPCACSASNASAIAGLVEP
jgi:hypothetical protein